MERTQKKVVNGSEWAVRVLAKNAQTSEGQGETGSGMGDGRLRAPLTDLFSGSAVRHSLPADKNTAAVATRLNSAKSPLPPSVLITSVLSFRERRASMTPPAFPSWQRNNRANLNFIGKITKDIVHESCFYTSAHKMIQGQQRYALGRLSQEIWRQMVN